MMINNTPQNNAEPLTNAERFFALRRKPERDVQRFLASLRKSTAGSGCWVYTGRTNEAGYGIFNVKIFDRRVNILAHRWSWEYHNNNKIPLGKIILHACDNPPCCNPAHLSVGTHRDNAKDMVSKGRQRKPDSPWKPDFDPPAV